MKIYDQHIHSIFSADSNELIENYYNIAKINNCPYFLTTEHLDINIANSGKDWIGDYKNVIDTLNKIKTNDGPIPLLGIEVGFRKEYISKIKEILSKFDFDVVNLSIHDNGKMEYYFEQGFIDYGISDTLITYYNQMEEALTIFDDFNVLSHIDYGFKTACKINPNLDFYDSIDQLKRILSLLIKKEKALEINTKVQSFFDDSHIRKLLRLYKSLGGTRLTLSSDAHKVKNFMYQFDKYLAIIKEEGFDELCYFIKREEHRFKI